MTGIEKEKAINGIDVSECKNFSCGICEEENKIPRTIGRFTADCTFYPNCYFKQLKRLQQELDIKEKMLDKFMIGSGETLEKLQKENEGLKKLKKYYKGFVANCRYCDEWYMDKCNYIKKDNKYEQALKEIRKEANRLLYELNPIYGYNNSNYFEILAKYVLAKTKEVLDDRN